MPFFVYLSGYVFSLAGKQAVADYGGFLRDRAMRLLLPFLLFGLLIVGENISPNSFYMWTIRRQAC